MLKSETPTPAAPWGLGQEWTELVEFMAGLEATRRNLVCGDTRANDPSMLPLPDAMFPVARVRHP
jgi:hypothetical protein